MGSEPYILIEHGVGALLSVFAFKSTPLPTYIKHKQQRTASVCASERSQHIYIAGVTSNITAHHVVFTAIKHSMRSRVEVPGPCIFVFTGKTTHIHVDIYGIHRLIETFCRQISHLRYAKKTSHECVPLSHEARG